MINKPDSAKPHRPEATSPFVRVRDRVFPCPKKDVGGALHPVRIYENPYADPSAAFGCSRRAHPEFSRSTSPIDWLCCIGGRCQPPGGSRNHRRPA